MSAVTGHDLIAAGWAPGPGYNEAIDWANYSLRNGKKRPAAIEIGIERGKDARAAYVPKHLRERPEDCGSWGAYEPHMMENWLPWSRDSISTKRIDISHLIVRDTPSDLKSILSSMWEIIPMADGMKRAVKL
ncbi:hypothetical protein [Rhizobium leguminosarum]|uniref:Uncharacterized protein n=1 Tax=Rhizobium leguminosarum TaxID=384 RepID=A0A7M3DQJ2_RHILE|nr:hypothetical protein [Rhizobium leguminosarum]TAY50948.1 hypothetical protein ELH90_04110 [Rhizobium leguminosarum]